MRQYGDLHPNIDSCMKPACPNEGYGNNVSTNNNISRTTPTLFNTFSVVWFLNQAHIMSRHGRLLIGITTITNRADELPDGLEIISVPGPCEYTSMC